MLINDTEYFCPFSKFTWFRGASLENTLNVKGDAGYMYWDELDIQLNEYSFKKLATIIRPAECDVQRTFPDCGDIEIGDSYKEPVPLNTTLKQGVPITAGYSISDLENGAVIQALIDKVNILLRPCDKCGRSLAEVDYYYSPSKDEMYPHNFYIRCRCSMRTTRTFARDSEYDIKSALNAVFVTWNRTLNNWEPTPPFSR
jgi:hypothetical protein